MKLHSLNLADASTMASATPGENSRNGRGLCHVTAFQVPRQGKIPETGVVCVT